MQRLNLICPAKRPFAPKPVLMAPFRIGKVPTWFSAPFFLRTLFLLVSS